jgi:phosphopantetheinyl transferase (holo-ACP synthase)
LILHGAARAAADEAGVAELSVSLTHEGDYSAAVVVVVLRQIQEATVA